MWNAAYRNGKSHHARASRREVDDSQDTPEIPPSDNDPGMENDDGNEIEERDEVEEVDY